MFVPTNRLTSSQVPAYEKGQHELPQENIFFAEQIFAEFFFAIQYPQNIAFCGINFCKSYPLFVRVFLKIIGFYVRLSIYLHFCGQVLANKVEIRKNKFHKNFFPLRYLFSLCDIFCLNSCM